MMPLSLYQSSRYMVPLREGGSLPAVMEMEGGAMFVVKFRGAGQGAKALIAEIIVGRIGQVLGLPVPEIGLIVLDAGLAKTERDPEIQDILNASVGVNVGLRYLESSFTFDPLAVDQLDPNIAAGVVWLDGLTTNIDRTARNPNLLYRSDGLWLIDHGAALYFHHNWPGVTDQQIASPFAAIKDHVLLRYVTDTEFLREADRKGVELLTDDLLRDILGEIPDMLLEDAPAGTVFPFADAEQVRLAYRDYFRKRLAGERLFVREAINATEAARNETLSMQSYRR